MSKAQTEKYNNDDELLQEAVTLLNNEEYEDAFLLFRNLAEEGFDSAQYYLGKCYEEGLGTAADKSVAFFWYFKAALQGNSDYQNNLGWCYNEGCGIIKSTKEAEHWYRLSAESGNLKAQCNLGILYLDRKDPEAQQAGIFWLKKAARKKDAIAELNLGVCYLEGSGTARDLKRALRYFLLAGEHGEGDGYNNAGICFQNGFGVEIDESKALELFSKAAQMDSPEGNVNLGYCYEKGIGTEVDLTNAFIYFEYAANLGDEVGMYKLGTMYENALYYGRDEEKALEWYQKAYKEGFEPASEAYIHLSNKRQAEQNPEMSEKMEKRYQENLELFEQGRFKEAYKGFEELAEFSHSGAMIHIGEIYLHAGNEKSGKDRIFNEEQAFKWFYKAAHQGNPEGFYRLAGCFDAGTGTVANRYRAVYWATKAQEAGLEKASEIIDRPESK